MATTHPTTSIRNGMADHVCNQLDNGTIEIQTSGAVALATMSLGASAYDAAVNGICSATNVPLEDTNASAGTAAQAQQKASTSTIIIQCSVTATGGGGDIELSSINFNAGDTVRLTSLTYETSV